MGASVSADDRAGAGVDDEVDTLSVRRLPAHTIDRASALVFETGVEQPSGGRAGDIADHGLQRRQPSVADTLAGVVLAGGPAVAKGIAARAVLAALAATALPLVGAAGPGDDAVALRAGLRLRHGRKAGGQQECREENGQALHDPVLWDAR